LWESGLEVTRTGVDDGLQQVQLPPRQLERRTRRRLSAEHVPAIMDIWVNGRT
jgi:hypothetical protein